MSAMLGGGYVNYFSMEGRSYRVMSQVQQEYRLNPSQVLDYYVRASNGTLVPLSTVAKISTKTVPESLSHFQQQNAATISGVMMPGQTLGDTLSYLQDLAHRVLPDGFYTDTAGQSRQFYQESSGFLNTFGFALIIIFLVARGAVRKLPRSADHSGLGADVDRGRHDLHLPRYWRRLRLTSTPRWASLP